MIYSASSNGTLISRRNNGGIPNRMLIGARASNVDLHVGFVRDEKRRWRAQFAPHCGRTVVAFALALVADRLSAHVGIIDDRMHLCCCAIKRQRRHDFGGARGLGTNAARWERQRRDKILGVNVA